jgi:SOS-response transcriptional repressor LexA
MSLAKKLKGARESAGISQASLAKTLAVSQPYLSQLETGRRKSLPPDLARSAAKALGLPPSEFAEFVSDQGAKAAGSAGRHRVIGTVEAGRGIDEQDVDEEWVNLPQECDGADGVYLVKGRSMVGAGILPYDYLVVRRTDTPADGDLVVAWTKDFGAVVKRVRVEAPDFHGRGTAYILLTEGDDKDNRYPYQLDREHGDRIYAVVVAVFRTYKSKPKAKGKK